MKWIIAALMLASLTAGVPRLGHGPRPGIVYLDNAPGPPDSVDVLLTLGKLSSIRATMRGWPDPVVVPHVPIADTLVAPSDSLTVWHYGNGLFWIGWVDAKHAPNGDARYVYRLWYRGSPVDLEELGP